MDGTALPVIGGSNPLKGRQESKFVKKSQEYARGTLGTMQTIEARPMHNISAAGMPSQVMSNTSTRNMQTKVNNKLFQGGTEEDYNRLSGVRNSKPTNTMKDDNAEKEGAFISGKIKRRN